MGVIWTKEERGGGGGGCIKNKEINSVNVVCVCRLGSYAASNNNSIGCISQTTARFGGVVYCTRGEEEMVWERGWNSLVVVSGQSVFWSGGYVTTTKVFISLLWVLGRGEQLVMSHWTDLNDFSPTDRSTHKTKQQLNILQRENVNRCEWVSECKKVCESTGVSEWEDEWKVNQVKWNRWTKTIVVKSAVITMGDSRRSKRTTTATTEVEEEEPKKGKKEK